MKFKSAIPILYSSDVARSLQYYTDKLGFESKWEWDSPPTFGGARRDKVEIFFCREAQGNPATWMSVFVEDVDDYFEEIQARGPAVLHPPQTYEWGVREMLVEDPDGHRIRFGQNTGEIVIGQNAFTAALRRLVYAEVKDLTEKEPQWLKWSETGGKNGLHFLCSLPVARKPAKAKASLRILQLLLERGMDIDAVHEIPEEGGNFPATPLWYAMHGAKTNRYTTGCWKTEPNLTTACLPLPGATTLRAPPCSSGMVQKSPTPGARTAHFSPL